MYSGIITLGSLSRFVENQMQGNVRQNTKFLAEGVSQSKMEDIGFAIAPAIYTRTIETTIENITRLLASTSGMESIREAAKLVDTLRSLDSNNSKIAEFVERIDTFLKAYAGPIIDWVTANAGVVRPKIEAEYPWLYLRLFRLVEYLSFDKVHNITPLDLCLLSTIYDVINGPQDITTFIRRCIACAKMFPPLA
jgi:hypothetical protein